MLSALIATNVAPVYAPPPAPPPAPVPASICIAPSGEDAVDVLIGLDNTAGSEDVDSAGAGSGNATRDRPVASASSSALPQNRGQVGDFCIECVIWKGLVHQGKAAADFPTHGKPADLCCLLVSACREATGELPTRAGDSDSHQHSCKARTSRQSCRNDIRLMLSKETQKASLAMYAKVRHNMRKHL